MIVVGLATESCTRAYSRNGTRMKAQLLLTSHPDHPATQLHHPNSQQVRRQQRRRQQLLFTSLNFSSNLTPHSQTLIPYFSERQYKWKQANSRTIRDQSATSVGLIHDTISSESRTSRTISTHAATFVPLRCQLRMLESNPRAPSIDPPISCKWLHVHTHTLTLTQVRTHSLTETR